MDWASFLADFCEPDIASSYKVNERWQVVYSWRLTKDSLARVIGDEMLEVDYTVRLERGQYSAAVVSVRDSTDVILQRGALSPEQAMEWWSEQIASGAIVKAIRGDTLASHPHSG